MKFYAELNLYFHKPPVKLIRLIFALFLITLIIYQLSKGYSPRIALFFLNIELIIEIFFHYKVGKAAPQRLLRKFLGEWRRFWGCFEFRFLQSVQRISGPSLKMLGSLSKRHEKLKDDNPKDKQLKYWLKTIHKVYEEAKAYPGPDPNIKPGLKEAEGIEKEKYFNQKLKGLCAPYIKTQLPQATLSARAIKYLSEMFTFVRFEGINPDNNMAERAIRKTVIKRKISFGTISKKGSETRSILRSLFCTWRLQNLNPFEQMNLLLAPACQGV